MQLFSAVFTLPQWKYFVTVLLGVLRCDEHRTLSALLRHVAAKVTIFGWCHLLSNLRIPVLGALLVPNLGSMLASRQHSRSLP